MKEPLFNIDKGAAGVWSFPVLNLFFVFYLFSFWLILQHRQGTEILCWWSEVLYFMRLGNRCIYFL